MEYKKINIDDLAVLKEIVGTDFVFSDEDKLLQYSSDETEDLSYPPEVVLKTKTTEEISKIIT